LKKSDHERHLKHFQDMVKNGWVPSDSKKSKSFGGSESYSQDISMSKELSTVS